MKYVCIVPSLLSFVLVNARNTIFMLKKFRVPPHLNAHTNKLIIYIIDQK